MSNELLDSWRTLAQLDLLLNKTPYISTEIIPAVNEPADQGKGLITYSLSIHGFRANTGKNVDLDKDQKTTTHEMLKGLKEKFAIPEKYAQLLADSEIKGPDIIYSETHDGTGKIIIKEPMLGQLSQAIELCKGKGIEIIEARKNQGLKWYEVDNSAETSIADQSNMLKIAELNRGLFKDDLIERSINGTDGVLSENYISLKELLKNMPGKLNIAALVSKVTDEDTQNKGDLTYKFPEATAAKLKQVIEIINTSGFIVTEGKNGLILRADDKDASNKVRAILFEVIQSTYKDPNYQEFLNVHKDNLLSMVPKALPAETMQISLSKGLSDFLTESGLRETPNSKAVKKSARTALKSKKTEPGNTDILNSPDNNKNDERAI